MILLVLQGDTYVSKEHDASVFAVEFCFVGNWLGYRDRLPGGGVRKGNLIGANGNTRFKIGFPSQEGKGIIRPWPSTLVLERRAVFVTVGSRTTMRAKSD